MKWIVIGPGAMAFYAFLGQMSQLDLNQVQAVSGASAGALLAFLWIVFDGSIPAILDFALRVPIDQLMKPNIKNFLNNFGMVPMNKLRRAITDALHKKFKTREMTFGELKARRPITLYVSAFCTERGQTVYFSHETHPGTSVVDAICASIAVPFLFSTVKLGDWRYVDGGFQEALPGLPFVTKPRHEVVAIHISAPPPKEPSGSLSSYIGCVFAGVLRLRHNYDYPNYCIDAEKMDIFDFSANGLELFVYGQKYRKIVNDAHYPIGLHGPQSPQEDHGQGESRAQVLHVHAEGGLYASETRADLRRGGDRQAEEGHVDLVRIPPGRGQDEPLQGSEQGDQQG
jgi:predicted acylesterase/phospholipase RssA